MTGTNPAGGRPPGDPGRADRPPAPGARSAAHPGAPDTDPERVLSQALRAMAGGPRPVTETWSTPARRRLTTGQFLLLAALIGLVIGVVAGLLTLVL